MNPHTSDRGSVKGGDRIIEELKTENDLLRRHLGTWKKLYDKLCDENERLSEKNNELYHRLHKLENGKVGQTQGA